MLSFFFQAEDGIRDGTVTEVQTCALPISLTSRTSNQLGLLTRTSALVDPQVTAAVKARAMFRYLPCGFGTSCELRAARVKWQLSGPVTLQKGRSVGLS